jgi:hypothetical protein
MLDIVQNCCWREKRENLRTEGKHSAAQREFEIRVPLSLPNEDIEIEKVAGSAEAQLAVFEPTCWTRAPKKSYAQKRIYEPVVDKPDPDSKACPAG